MRTVLIPTDFSANARCAIEYALQLYKCEQTRFCFLHAYADEVYGGLTGNSSDTALSEQKRMVKESKDKALNALTGEIRKETSNPRHSYKAVLAFESLVDAVNEFVNRENTDMVIMGTRGETGDRKITFGSHTVQVFKYVQCPVLAIPDNYAFRQPKHILFPTDYMIPYKRRELKLLCEIATEYKSEVHFLYISDSESLSRRQLDNQKFVAETLANNFLYFERTPEKNKVQAIMENISEKDINLLVMVNTRNSMLEEVFFRSTVDKLGLHIKIPFLVMQNLPR